jgi:hypothetical protein
MNKTIEINPALFRGGGGSKTKKNKEPTSKPKNPLISPNILKNKLLKRIKQHKLRENNQNSNNPNINVVTSVSPSYTDEFVESLDYLQNLSKQKQMSDQKQANEIKKQKNQSDLERKTVKNYNSMNNQHVHIDLPEELSNAYVPNISSLTLVKNNDSVPYGILKGGNKPTYRVWNKTQKNSEPSIAFIAPTPITSERENRLNILKDKIKQKEHFANQAKKEDVWLDKTYIQKPVAENLRTSATAPVNEIKINTQVSGPKIVVSENDQSLNNPSVDDKPTPGRRRFIKKTKHRKYTLGKSNIKKTVSVLLKDRQTRKKILTAQKDLKRKPINEVKNYLREHNLLKTGSDAPNDILRKIYEDAVLAGEITNINKDILLHNFLKSDDA